jgi:hypothetical protein
MGAWGAVTTMLYGSDYQSPEQVDSRLLRRYRRDVMFVAARPQEVIAAGLVAGLVVVPLLLVVGSIVIFLFSIIFNGTITDGGPPVGNSLTGAPPTATSGHDLILVVGAIILTLVIAGGLSAALRRFDYKRQGGLQFYLHHPRSTIGLAGFFTPVTLMTMVGLLIKSREASPALQTAGQVAAPSMLDRGVVYLFLGILLSMLLYLVWESFFPVILPTLSDLDVDAEVARRQREDRERIRAEEAALRSRKLA